MLKRWRPVETEKARLHMVGELVPMVRDFFDELALKLETARRTEECIYTSVLQKFSDKLAVELKDAKKTQDRLDRFKASLLNVIRAYVRPDENRLSDIIADLLDPEGPHGQGPVFLAEFLRIIKPELSAADAEVISREQRTDTGRRIDIFLKFRRSRAIAIENKLSAKEQEGQIGDYCTFLKGRCGEDYTMIYLTPDGSPPCSIDRERREILIRKGKLRSLSYRVEIRSWLGACLAVCEAWKTKWLLEDLIEFMNEDQFLQGTSSREGDGHAE